VQVVLLTGNKIFFSTFGGRFQSNNHPMEKPVKLTLSRIYLLLLAASWITLHSGCISSTEAKMPQASIASLTAPAPEVAEPVSTVIADAATIIARPEVPVLCYHQIREFRATDSKTAKDYIVTVADFRAQMQILADSGYHAIIPDQLYDYLTTGKALPSKPVMITFDDTRLDQYTAALPELNKHGFKGVFFIMTVSLGRPGYMSKEQVKELADEGHTVGSHTYDHQNVKKYVAEDWQQQVQKPSKQLEAITGKPVEYFAYPFGLWNKDAIAGLKNYKFKAVFQLSDRRDENDPLYSIRRVIIPGGWSANSMLRCMKGSFNKIK
jgi:peptidoglycan/xylan/chitin deacetylase (PgdA/CDA1 family)